MGIESGEWWKWGNRGAGESWSRGVEASGNRGMGGWGNGEWGSKTRVWRLRESQKGGVLEMGE